jgi:integrase
LETARKWRRVTYNVAELVELPKLDQVPKAPLDAEARQKLLAAATDPENHAAVIFALGTGMRRGELRGLRWSDFSFERRTITVARSLQSTKADGLRFKLPKDGKARTFQAPAFVLEELKRPLRSLNARLFAAIRRRSISR